jgi:hypothetical protein
MMRTICTFKGTANQCLGIWIRMFLGLPDLDPDLLVRGTDPDPDPAPNPSLFSKLCERTEIMPAEKHFKTKLD